MADDAVKELVAKLTLDTSGWGDAVKEARASLLDADSEDKARQVASKAASDSAIASIKEQVASQQLLKEQSEAQAAASKASAEAAKAQAATTKAAADNAVAASSQTTASERAKAAAIESAAAASRAANEQTLASTKAQAAAAQAAHANKMADMQAEQAILAKEIAERSLNIKKIQEEVAATRAKVLEEHNAAKEEKEGFGVKQLLGGPATILAGGKGSFGASLLGGLVGGAAGTAVFETLSEGLTKLTEKIKEFVEDSGGLQKVLETFAKLNELKFGDNGTEFLDQLKDKTHNLVAETDLLRNANTFMGSSLKVSKQQMLDLTEATVGLARGQGHDATQAVQGLTRMFLTGGRGAMQMARIIGVQLPRSAAAGLGPLATQTQKAQAQFEALSKQILSTYASLGAPSLTFTDRLTQMKVVTNELFEAVAQGAVKSTGFTLLIHSMGDFIDKMGGAEGMATKLGDAIGNAFAPAVVIFKAITPIFQVFVKTLKDTVSFVDSLVSSFADLGDKTDPIATNFAKLHPVVNLLATAFAALAGTIAITLNGIDTAVKIADKLTSNRNYDIKSDAFQAYKSKNIKDKGEVAGSVYSYATLGKFQDDYKKTHPESAGDRYSSVGDILTHGENKERDIENQFKKIAADLPKEYAAAEKSVKGLLGGKPLVPPIDPAAARREAIAEAKARLDAQKKLADANFADAKQLIENEKDANEALYKQGAEGATAYYETKKKLDLETFNAAIKHINEEEDAAKQGLQNRLKDNEISPTTFKILTEATTTEFHTKRVEAQTTLNKGVSTADIAETAERNREQIEFIGIELDARKAAITQETQAVKTAYAEQLISGKEYFAKSLAFVEDNAQAVIDAESKKQKTGLRPEQLEVSLKTQQKAYEDAYKTLETLDEHFTQEQLANTQKRFSNISGTISAQAEIGASEGGVSASPSTQLAFLQQQRDATDAQIQSLQELLSTTRQYSDSWFQIYDAILAATKQTQQLSDQMQQLSSYSGAAGNVLSDFAKNTQNVFTSRYGRGFVSALSGAGESLSTSTQQVQQIFGKKTPEVDKLQPYINATKEATAGIIDSAKTSASGLDTFSSSIKTAKDALVEALNDLAFRLKSIILPASQIQTPQVATAAALADTTIQTDHPYVAAPELPIIKSAETPVDNTSKISNAEDTFVSAVGNMSAAMRNILAPSSALPKSPDEPDYGSLAVSPTAITSTTPAVPVLLSPASQPSTVLPTGASIAPSVPQTQSGLSVAAPSTDTTPITHIGPDVNDGGGITQAGNGLLDFSKKITSAIGAVGGFINSITSAGSASAGAFGGGVSGAGLGQAAGSSLGQSGGPLSSLGSFAGPFGALIGAGIGSALGGIMGQKQEEVTRDINQLNVSYKTIMNNYSANNASLKQTITNLQQLIAQAQADQASTKKGGSQFADLIKSYNEQIQQLQDQATQTMAQLSSQLAVITSPVPFQSLLSSIQSVIQQYSQFAGSAQNATDLANANQFLASSLANIGEQYKETLLQNEVSAIADALHLNDLYSQRNALQLQFLQSTEQIMGQGTLTRQITQSQSKFSQLYTLDVNHQNQLDALNQEINVTQYKVQAEQQIFDLATTKQGLEQQTLILQEQGINLDMARISAMQTLLATLQSSNYSITNLAGVDTSNPNALMNMLLQLLISQLGISGSAASSSNTLDSLLSGTYSSRAQYGYASFRSNNL